MSDRAPANLSIAANVAFDVLIRRLDELAIDVGHAVHRADFERERDRSDNLMAEDLKLAAVSARKTAARLEGELAARQSRPWWKRLTGWQEAGTAALASSQA